MTRPPTPARRLLALACAMVAADTPFYTAIAS